MISYKVTKIQRVVQIFKELFFTLKVLKISNLKALRIDTFFEQILMPIFEHPTLRGAQTASFHPQLVPIQTGFFGQKTT